MRNHLALFFGIVALQACKTVPEKNVSDRGIATEFHIEILREEGNRVIDSLARIQILAGGFQWTEGPLWIADGNYLLFSDIPGNAVHRWDAKNGTTLYLQPSGYSGKGNYSNEPGSNGLLLNATGELVLLQHGDRRIVKMNAPLHAPHEDFVPLVDHYEGKKFNSPNDAVYDKDDNLYFTDPPYGLPSGAEDPTKELKFQGVYSLLQKGHLVLLDSLTRPNGIALSADETKLFVAVSDPEHAVWYVYDVAAPGEISNKKLFYDVTPLIGKEGEQGLPDGMVMSTKDYLFASGPGGIWIFNMAGAAIARIHTGQATSNCTLSGDEKTLFITADDYVLSVQLK